jgi:hypothetical protein
MFRLPEGCWGWTLLFVALGLSGCSTMHPAPQRDVSESVPSASATLVFRPSGKEPESKSIEIPPDATVSSTLKSTGAARKFSRAKVHVERQLPNGAWHKMAVECDLTAKRVDPMHDYHLRPDDRLVVTEDTTDMWDDMMKSTAGPLGILNR